MPLLQKFQKWRLSRFAIKLFICIVVKNDLVKILRMLHGNDNALFKIIIFFFTVLMNTKCLQGRISFLESTHLFIIVISVVLRCRIRGAIQQRGVSFLLSNVSNYVGYPQPDSRATPERARLESSRNHSGESRNIRPRKAMNSSDL